MVKLLSALFLSLSVSTVAFAGFVGPGSTTGLATVKSVHDMRDDDKVTLEGYIIKEIRSEHFIFKDTTGEIEIEIDNEDFKNITVTPETRVRISGEIDKEFMSVTIDVDTVELAK